MKRTVLTGVLALLSASLAAPPARAGDTKKYPAFMCQEAGSAPTGTVSRDEFRVSKVAGAAGTKATLICPIVHDTFSGASFGFDVAAFDVVDSLLGADVSCALVARNNVGTSVFFETRQTSSINSNVQQLSYTGGSFAAALGQNTNYYFTCQLPANNLPEEAKLVSYSVEEL